MRHKLIIGLGIAGAFAGSAIAQLPATPTTPALPPAYQPVLPMSPGSAGPPAAGRVPSPYVPPPGGVLPAGYTPVPAETETRPTLAPPPPTNLEIRTAIPADHPWLIKPEHGAYFISVKSYSRPNRPTADDKGPSALALAEALAGEIRDLYRVQTFLFEYVSEERKAEMAAIAAARERGRIFAQQMEKLRQQSQLQGMEFLEPDKVIRFKTVNYRDQIAVLIGGFKTDEDARKALDTVRKWAAPKTKVAGTSLMDWGTVVRPGPDGKQFLEQSHINPYTTATVVPNPTIARAAPAPSTEIDPFIVRLNDGRPYNLLKVTKAWTLAVKSFTAPIELVSKNGGDSVMRKPSILGSKGSDALKAGAEQAEALAKTLRELKGLQGQSLGLEAFVLHTRTSSIVTVGQFDSPDDPELVRIQHQLGKIKLTEDREGHRPVANAPKLFETMMAIPVPRKQQ
jgi:hypothetical protein